MSSHHRILGVPTNATKLQIKRAYYKKSKLLHPDVNKSPNAAKDFARLNEAYEALTNPKYKIPKVTFRPRPQKSKEQLRREALKRRQAAARKHAEEIMRKYRARQGQMKPIDIMKRDLKKIGNYLFGLLVISFLCFCLPFLFFVGFSLESLIICLQIILGTLVFGIFITSPGWIGIITFYLFPEEK